MKVALVAFSVRGAMGQYIEALSRELANFVELYLFVPNQFEPEGRVGLLFQFPTGRNHLLALRRLVNPLGGLRLWEQIQGVKPDVVHIFNGEGYPWALILAQMAAHRGLPLVVTVHDPVPHPGNLWEWLNAHMRPYVLKRAVSVHVHSGCFADAVKVQGAKDICVIPHGSLAPRFLRYANPGIQREPLVLFFGRLEPYKGLETLIEAGIMLEGKLRVAIAGPGRLPKKLVKRVSHYDALFELHNRFLHECEVAELFQRASVCVLPYRQASQSAIPLIAAAFGVPVVATAVGAFVEDVPRVNGLLVPPGDAVALKEAVLSAVGRPPTYPAELEFPAIAGQFVEWYARHVPSR